MANEKAKPWKEVGITPHPKAEECYAVMWTVKGEACERMETFPNLYRAKGYAREMADLRVRAGLGSEMGITIYKVRREAVAAYVPAEIASRS